MGDRLRPVLAAVGTALLTAIATPAAPAAAGQTAVEVRRDVRYGTAGDAPLLLDAYVPAATGAPRPAVVLLHGGGWRGGDKASFAEEAERLAERGWVAFSVNYRLTEPEAFPAEVDDVRAAVRWVRDNASTYGVDPARVGALGESAGGHLAALLGTSGDGDLGAGARIRVGVAWSGPMDLSALARSRGPGWSSRLLPCSPGDCPDRWAEASPTTHVDGSDAPLLLVNSTAELVPLAQAETMAGRLRAAGVDHRLDVLPGNRHALDYRSDAWPATVEFLARYLEPEATGPGEDVDGDDGLPVALVASALAVAAVAGVAVALGRRRRRRADQARNQSV